MNKIDIAILDELRKATRQEQLAYLLSLSEAEFEAVVEDDLQDLQDGMDDEQWVREGC